MTARAIPFLLVAILSFGAVVLAVAMGSDTIEQARLAARWTARAGFPILILTYSASSLVRLWPNPTTKTLLRHRRQWGLGFALAHSIHLGALVTYHVISGQPPQPATLIGGGGAYVLLYAMALTSNDASMRAMGAWWKRLHRTGIHALWFVFALSYFGQVFTPGFGSQGSALFLICVAALGLRLWAWAKVRRKLVAT
jgi:DMSO/TMAO reductase YedYZ heme-binding membrane subunit